MFIKGDDKEGICGLKRLVFQALVMKHFGQITYFLRLEVQQSVRRLLCALTEVS